MDIGVGEVTINRGPLFREPLSAALEGLSQEEVSRLCVHGHVSALLSPHDSLLVTLHGLGKGCQPEWYRPKWTKTGARRDIRVSGPRDSGLLTLEPFIEAVQDGVEDVGWQLSGLQKTTSHRFEGRWDGESTRSAYLFFHSDAGPDCVSIDVYLDETTQGLAGNIALVVDLVPLGELGDTASALRELSSLSAAALSTGRRRPVTLRLRLEDAETPSDEAETEVRFKLRIPRGTIAEGPTSVRALVREAVAAFEQILSSGRLSGFMQDE